MSCFPFLYVSTDPDHRSQYAHPNDSNHHASSGDGHGQFVKQKCSYGASCYKYVYVVIKDYIAVISKLNLLSSPHPHPRFIPDTYMH